jgi:predicted AlkP superfamily pyrophosphatase or phosphodiesterase
MYGMRFITLVFTFLIVSTACAQQAKHVILISIDGFRPDFYRESSWPTPTIQFLAENGVSADLVRGVYPSVTYPSHTTIITGAYPAQHGIYYNSPFEPEGYTGKWYWYEKDIKTDNLWRAVDRKGLVSANLFWPVSVGVPADYSIPEFWDPGNYDGFYDFIKKHDVPEDLIEQVELNATGVLNASTFNGDYLNREARTAYMAAYLIENYMPNFLAVHLIGTDHFQHEEGRDGLKVRQSLVAVDYAVNEIMEACDRAGILEQTAFIVTGDHGFVNINTVISPNRWLVDAGLMEDQPDRGDWKATFHTTGASAFLYLRDPEDLKTLERVEKILEELPSSTRKLFTVLDRTALENIGASPEAALALDPIQGVNFTAKVLEKDIAAADGGTHGYRMMFPDIHTGFIGYGAGFRSNVQTKIIGLEDIAPIISALLELDFTAPEGVLFPGLLIESDK